MEVTLRAPAWARRIASDLTDMDRDPRPVEPGAEVRYRVPDDAYLEYAWIDADGALRADPANPSRADNPWYPEVSAVRGPDYRPDALADPPAPPEPAVVERLRVASEHLRQQRRLVVVAPAGFGSAELPLVLVQDGIAFYRLARLADVLDALVRAGQARPARLVFVEPLERSREYAFHAGYRDFVADELLPHVRERFPSTGETVAVGASLGGLFSATLALQRPGVVDAVATFSGAFLGRPEEPDFYRGTRSFVAEELERGAGAGVRWYAEVGTLEWLTDVNRRVARALEGHGVEHAFAERHAGHNWTNWRNGLASALRFAMHP